MALLADGLRIWTAWLLAAVGGNIDIAGRLWYLADAVDPVPVYALCCDSYRFLVPMLPGPDGSITL